MLVPGVALIVVFTVIRGTPLPASGVDDFRWVPGEILTRTGVCLMILGVVVHASRRIAQLPHALGAVAQESLVVYFFLHLCIKNGLPDLERRPLPVLW